MKPTIRMAGILALAAFVLSTFAPALMSQEGHDHMAAKAAKASPLDPLKKLEGEWSGKAGADGKLDQDATVIYKVTAAGTAVMETQFPGGNHEMITLYTVENGQIALTHYCSMGNQPRMKATRAAAANQLAFDFAGGAGINPKTDMHMHSSRITFVDDDRIVSEWTLFDKGKAGHVMRFELERKK